MLATFFFFLLFNAFAALLFFQFAFLSFLPYFLCAVCSSALSQLLCNFIAMLLLLLCWLLFACCCSWVYLVRVLLALISCSFCLIFVYSFTFEISLNALNARIYLRIYFFLMQFRSDPFINSSTRKRKRERCERKKTSEKAFCQPWQPLHICIHARDLSEYQQ